MVSNLLLISVAAMLTSYAPLDKGPITDPPRTDILTAAQEIASQTSLYDPEDALVAAAMDEGALLTIGNDWILQTDYEYLVQLEQQLENETAEQKKQAVIDTTNANIRTAADAMYGEWCDRVEEKVRKRINPFRPGGLLRDMEIVYRGNGIDTVLTADDVIDWVRWWPDGHWDIDDDKIAEYMDYLESVYNTGDQERIFKTTIGKKYIKIPPGNFGWIMDRQSEKKEISKLLRINGRTVHRIEFSCEGAEDADPTRDYGDSYIEVDLTNQKLFLYKHGRIILSTKVVTGSKNWRDTPTGIYAIQYRQTNAVLNGPGYSCPVSYWMPFFHGYGLHDATWRGSFGGDIYTYDGSHGCVNLPLKKAKRIFNNVTKGYPVIVHN